MRDTCGRFHILAFMDDFKCHTSSKKGLKTLTQEIERSAAELGLKLNREKCGMYSRVTEPIEEEETPFLPAVRNGYKYLGIEQLERDINTNYETVKAKAIQTTEQIFKSPLTTPQKAQLFNSTVIPSIIYIMGNLYPDEKRATTLKKCRDLDKEVRKVLVKENIKGKTTSNDHVYLPTNKGGIGLRSIELETEIQMVRKGIYLRSHPEMQAACKNYEALQRGGWRNPLSDHDFVVSKYNCPDVEYTQGKIAKNCKTLKQHIENTFFKQQQEEWAKNMHYGKVFIKEMSSVELPAYSSPLMDSWRFSLLHSTAEEQVHGLGAIPGRRRDCRKGCSQPETAYHVSTACIQEAYNARHDFVVHWVLKSLLTSLGAPEEIRLQFGKASLCVDFLGKRRTEIRAGGKILTEKRLHHNKPLTSLYTSTILRK
ncbi:uncharacterized protein LOC123310991 [Coccinella septempunctata]|uniref:uncharacterized protein LOC123310991 n=1 Tax=Coccinella septempunctata TaxID=41139 RepID=UPI001D08F4D1|nr:uncharacterized protein LOC123310991 [Coccinella septempunctata]